MRYRRGAASLGPVFGITVLVLAGMALYPAMAADTKSYVDSARAYEEKGDFKAAEIELRNALRQAPQDAHVHALLAQVYLKLDLFSMAEREARAARDLNADESDYLQTLAGAMMGQGKFVDIPSEIKPGDRPPELESKVRLILAGAALGSGDRGKTEALLREAVAINPTALEPKLVLARQVIRTKPDEAEKLVDEALAADPKSAAAIVTKGDILAEKHDANGATQRFEEALAIDPNNVDARLGRANVNLARGDYDNLDKDLDSVLKTAPKNARAHYLRALEYFKKQNFAAADEIFDKLSSGFNNMPEGLYFQAANKFGLRQYDQAANIINKYVARVPEDPAGIRLAATVALRRGEPDIAIQYLTTYLAKAKPDVALLALLGNAYSAAHKNDLALEQFQKAASLAPDNQTLKAYAAASQIDAGASRKGLEELEQVAATDTGASAAGPTLVLADLNAGRIDKAAEIAEQLMKRDGDSTLYQTLLGIVRAKQQNYPAAEAIFKAIVDRQSDSVPARTNLAQIYLASGKIEEAKKTYQDLLVSKPQNVSALLGLADVATVTNHGDEAIEYTNKARAAAPSDPAPGLKLLAIYAAQRNWTKAKNLASELVVQFPSNVDILDFQGRVLVSIGDQNEALESYRRAYPLAPNSEQILSRYLSLLVSTKRLPEYRDIQEARLRKDPANRTIKAQLIRVEGQIDGLNAGLDKARSFAKNDPDNQAFYDIDAASLYEEFDKRSDAIALLQQTKKTWPENDEVVIALAAAYNRAGDSTKGEAVLTDRLKERPGAVAIRVALTQFYIKNEKLDLALKEATQVVVERPDDPLMLNNLAWLYQQRGDLTKAREFAEKAVRLAPANASIVDTLGWILFAQGDTENALARLRAASAAMPGDPDIGYHFAAALDRAGRTADARAVLEQLLGTGASFASKAEAEKLLNTLKRG